MTRVHYSIPPEVAEHAAARSLGPCLPCLLRAKGRQVIAHRPEWQAALNDGDDTGELWIPYDVQSDIREAVAVGMVDMFPGVLVPVCWDDMGAIEPPNPVPLCKWCGGTGHKATGLEPAAGPLPLPPGLGGNGSHKRGRG
jgi:hypothetical protein